VQIPGTDVAFLSRFVPRHAQRMLSERTELPSSEEESFVLGAAFVADIAGFTALTEMLDITQDEGADVLSEALQRIFVSLDDIVGRHGGEVVHLAGDGLFAIWPVAHSDRLAHAVGRSVACGLEIQSEAPGIDVLEGQRLRLRVGVGAGSLWLPVVGGFGARWAAPVGGAPLQQISTALDAARPGDVVVSSEAVALAGNTLSGAVTPAGLMRIESADLPPPNEGVRGEPLPTALLEHFVPEIVAARASAGLMGRFAELRQATSVFAKVHSLDADAPHRLVRLQEMTIAFQESVRRYDGAVTVTLLDEVGLSLVGTRGG
jgi:class 3 adenylate cyclase